LDDKRKNIDEKLKEAKYLKDLSDIEYVLETTDDEEYLPKSPISHIIIDCSPFNYVDSVGIQGLVHVNK
jgi:anti-anti-sigma regulatory factor